MKGRTEKNAAILRVNICARLNRRNLCGILKKITKKSQGKAWVEKRRNPGIGIPRMECLKMKKSELIRIMAEKAGLSKKDAQKGLDALLESIIETVKEGEKVSLVNFGTFDCYYRAGRPGSNPKTGEPMAIAACYSPRFKAGRAFKQAVNP